MLYRPCYSYVGLSVCSQALLSHDSAKLFLLVLSSLWVKQKTVISKAAFCWGRYVNRVRTAVMAESFRLRTLRQVYS